MNHAYTPVCVWKYSRTDTLHHTNGMLDTQEALAFGRCVFVHFQPISLSVEN